MMIKTNKSNIQSVINRLDQYLRKHAFSLRNKSAITCEVCPIWIADTFI